MSRIDKAPEAGKFRCKAAAALDGQIGVWGDEDLVNVTLNASGELVIGAAADTIGFILTTEGKLDRTHADYKDVIGGRVYTVFRQCEVIFESPTPALVAGDEVWATAAGTVDTTGAVAESFIGFMVADDNGTRLVAFVAGPTL